MLRLKFLVTTEEDEDASFNLTNADGMPHGTSVSKELVIPWAMTDRTAAARFIVCLSCDRRRALYVWPTFYWCF